MGRIADEVLQEAFAAWRKKLVDHTTLRLSRTWFFHIGGTSAGDQLTMFPRIKPPNTEKLTAILERLEARGFEHGVHRAAARWMGPIRTSRPSS